MNTLKKAAGLQLTSKEAINEALFLMCVDAFDKLNHIPTVRECKEVKRWLKEDAVDYCASMPSDWQEVLNDEEFIEVISKCLDGTIAAWNWGNSFPEQAKEKYVATASSLRQLGLLSKDALQEAKTDRETLARTKEHERKEVFITNVGGRVAAYKGGYDRTLRWEAESFISNLLEVGEVLNQYEVTIDPVKHPTMSNPCKVTFKGGAYPIIVTGRGRNYLPVAEYRGFVTEVSQTALRMVLEENLKR